VGLTRWAALALVAACSNSPSRPPATGQEPTPPTAAPAVTDAAAPGGDSIGVATMQADGTIVLDLRATDGAGATGDARLVYGKDHKDYQMVLDHLGGLAPGDSKPVPPFP
jgi:hypothetical protein